jgi:iron complex transport system ATP-binding protein
MSYPADRATPARPDLSRKHIATQRGCETGPVRFRVRPGPNDRAGAPHARATVGEPELLIVDEPTAGLDPRHAFDAGARLRALADAGCTVVVALHDLDLALRIADDVLALKDGRVVAHGGAAEVFADATLSALYDVAVRVTRDDAGAAIRFLG